MSPLPVGAAPTCDGKPFEPLDFGVERFSVAAVLDRRAEQYPDRVMITCRLRYRHVMSEGYLRPSDPAVVPHPQWFRTGDRRTFDGDQNLTYAARVKDSMLRRGENIFSVEVETVVMRHPAVLEAARYVKVVSELPKTVVGRIRKDVLRARIESDPRPGAAKPTDTS